MPDSQSLLELPTVRTQCLAVSKAPLSFWEVDDTALPAVVDFVLSLIARDYDNEATRIRPHGRWGHFLAAGTDRISPLLAAWREEGTDESEICRRMIDLTLISVLLDAGAGSWEYTEPGSGTKIGRSEGLAVASLHMFKEGIFSSSSSQKHRVDAQGLKAVTHKALMEGLQVSPENPMPGAEGRVELLMRLGDVLDDPQNALHFKRETIARPGFLFDALQNDAEHGLIPVTTLWTILINGLAKVWPQDGRTRLHGKVLGDVWVAPGLLPNGVTPQDASEAQREQAMVPFHKLTQWLCYSLVEVIETISAYKVKGKELQTGLPEYRNAGLLTDFGVFNPKLEAFANTFNVTKPISMHDLPPLGAAHPGIIEWRALTVVYLDRIHEAVCKEFGAQLSLAQVLEAGTWKAGREIAKQKRSSGGPPFNILSDGTVF